MKNGPHKVLSLDGGFKGSSLPELMERMSMEWIDPMMRSSSLWRMIGDLLIFIGILLWMEISLGRLWGILNMLLELFLITRISLFIPLVDMIRL